MHGQKVACLVNGSQSKQHTCRRNTQRTGPARGAKNPTCAVRRSGAYIRQSHLGIQQQRRNAAISQLPDCTIKNEMVNVHESGENQKAGGEIVMEELARQPWTWDE